MKSVPSITISLESIKENLQLYTIIEADSLYDAEDSLLKQYKKRGINWWKGVFMIIN
ncbi:MAG: hypothetical protein IPN49_11920 [Saprospiraceae bacterium]|nr:hypothetical protein [Saprospiraceae bacterium]